MVKTLKHISLKAIYDLKEVLRNKTLLKIMRNWNKFLKESQYIRIFTERCFKQREVYNYVNLEELN